MINTRNVFTLEGRKAYQRKLKSLQDKAKTTGKSVGEEAGDQCDWHDNFGFEQARRDFEKDSKRAMDLQAAISNAEIIDIIEQSTRVGIGSTVSLSNENSSKEITIGAWGESDPKNGLISYTAPLAKAVLGKAVDDEIKFNTTTFTIDEIHPASFKYRKLVRDLYTQMDAENI